MEIPQSIQLIMYAVVAILLIGQIIGLVRGTNDQAISGYKKLDKSKLHHYNLPKARRIQAVLYCLVLLIVLIMPVMRLLDITPTSPRQIYSLIAVIVVGLILFFTPFALRLSKQKEM